MPPRVTNVQRALPQATPPPANGMGEDGDSVWGSLDTLRMLLYGESGTGKTTFWATFPGPILCLLCSGGDKPGELLSVNTPEYRRKITPRVIRSFGDLDRKVADARDFQTVVLDHASGLADLILGEIIGRPVPAQKGWGMATRQQYGQLSLQCKEAFRVLLNLPTNVVIVAQQRTFGGDDDDVGSDVLKPTVGAGLTPSVTGWLNPACDYVVQTFKRPVMENVDAVVGGKTITTQRRGKGVQYCLRTAPHDIYQTKFRVPKGTELPEVIVDPDYSQVRALVDGRRT